MTEVVVDRLELVDVQHDDAERDAVPLRGLPLNVDAVHGVTTVRQPRERVRQ